MKDTETVLIFGNIKSGGAICRRIFFGDEAYEKHMLPEYMHEIIQLRKNKNDCGGVFAELASYVQGCDSFWELGSTLFSSVDKYKNCKQRYELPNISFVGIEPSDLLKNTAIILHPEVQIKQYSFYFDAPKPKKAVHRSYQASSYAFQSTDELLAWVTQFQTSQDGIWFSTSGKDESHEVLGNEVTLFSLQKYKNGMKKNGFSLTFHSAQKVHHIGFELFEVFVLAHKGEIAEAKALEDINWLNDKYIPHNQGKFADSIKYRRRLDFTNSKLLTKMAKR